MRAMATATAAIFAATAGTVAAAGVGDRAPVSEAAFSATARSQTYPTRTAGGRSDFRHARFMRFGGPPGGAWGFQDGSRRGGERRGVERGPFLFPYPFEGYGYGVYGYGQGPFGPEHPYGDSAEETGYPPQAPAFAPMLAAGPYGRGPAYRGAAYVSGGGTYAYGYPGYAETPALPPGVPSCGC